MFAGENEMPATAESEWIRLTLKGDKEAFDRLFKKHNPALRAHIERRVGTSNAEDAEDVLQEVWLRAFKELESVRRPESLRAWLVRIAEYRTADFFRRRKNNLLKRLTLSLPVEVQDLEDGARCYDRKDTQRRVHEGLSRL